MTPPLGFLGIMKEDLYNAENFSSFIPRRICQLYVYNMAWQSHNHTDLAFSTSFPVSETQGYNKLNVEARVDFLHQCYTLYNLLEKAEH